MNTPETLADFHHRYLADHPDLAAGGAGASQCYVYSSEEPEPQWLPYQRRDFYKVALLTAGRGQLHYASRSLRIEAPALVFSNPLVPYSWEKEAGPYAAKYCAFTEAFWRGEGGAGSRALAELPLFRPGGSPVFLLEPAPLGPIQQLFAHLRAEAATDYAHKPEVLRNYLQLLLHAALKLQPPRTYQVPPAATARVAHLFLDLLERQFPLLASGQPLRLRTPADYAAQLAVHVNYLNRAVRRATGRTTSAHLAARLVQEATTLLRHSPWTIGEISDALGFAYPSYFDGFYKKHTGHTPRQARQLPPAVV